MVAVFAPGTNARDIPLNLSRTAIFQRARRRWHGRLDRTSWAALESDGTSILRLREHTGGHAVRSRWAARKPSGRPAAIRGTFAQLDLELRDAEFVSWLATQTP